MFQAMTVQEALHAADSSSGIRRLDASNIHFQRQDWQDLIDLLRDNDALEYLDLSNNCLGDDNCYSLAKALRKNRNLKDLLLNCTGIGGDALSSLVNLFTKLHSNIERLELQHNNFQNSKPRRELARLLACQSSLTHLHLGLNDDLRSEAMEMIGPALAVNRNLRVLNLSGTQIGDKGVRILSECLCPSRARRLVDLSLDKGSTAKVYHAPGGEIWSPTVLQELHLGNNNLSGASLAYLSALLNYQSSIELLSLDQNPRIGARGRSLTDLFTAQHSLQSLSLTSCKVARDGVTALKHILSTSCLRKLNLSGNSICDIACRELGDVLSSNQHLEDLDLSQNFINKEGAQYLGKALTSNTTLTALKLTGNALGDAGASSIADAIGHRKNFETLGLGNSELYDTSIPSIVRAGALQRNLCHLNLRGNNIAEEGAKLLAQWILTVCPLTFLDLSFNHLGPIGAYALAKALKLNPASQLKVLNLAWNAVGDVDVLTMGEKRKIPSWTAQGVGTQTFAEALRKNKHLRYLGLARNHFSMDTIAAIASTLYENDTLEMIDVRENEIGGSQSLLAFFSLFEDSPSIGRRLDFGRGVLLPRELQPAVAYQWY